MSKRRIRSTKVLAIAVLSTGAATGCAKTASEPQTPTPVADVAPAPESAQAPVMPSTETTPAPADTEATNASTDNVPAAQEALTKAELHKLRDDLSAAGPEGAKTDRARFRPLCDEQGFPLVGNVVRKGNDSGEYQPSAFCTDVREAK